jgi:hypothetical protein
LVVDGPTADTEMTSGASPGRIRQVFSTVRGRAASGGKSGLVSSYRVGAARSWCSLPAAPTSVTPRPWAYVTAPSTSSRMSRCWASSSSVTSPSTYSSRDAQLYSHGSVKKLMLTTSSAMSPAYTSAATVSYRKK